MINNINMLFASNDSRSKHLETELFKRVKGYSKVEYDPIPFLYKYLAAMLTFHSHRKTWWHRYQWHTSTQSGRRHRLLKIIRSYHIDFNVFFMWGSWFHPFINTEFENIPFYVYIDQSCNKKPDDYDIRSKALEKARIEFNKSQYVLYQNCRAIFCMSDWARRQTIESHMIPPEKVYKVGWGPIGVNLLHEKISINEKDHNVLFVGHEFYRKGVDFIRQAIPIVLKEIPNVRFKIVGANTDGLTVEPHPNLDLLGTIQNVETLEDIYRNASLFVLPHRFDRSPHVLIEAMSAGKPVITSMQGGAPEVVRNGISGYLIDVGDVKSLAHHILTLLKNKNMRISFGEEGRKIMQKDHTWESIASKMLKIINETR